MVGEGSGSCGHWQGWMEKEDERKHGRVQSDTSWAVVVSCRSQRPVVESKCCISNGVVILQYARRPHPSRGTIPGLIADLSGSCRPRGIKNGEGTVGDGSDEKTCTGIGS